MLNWKKQAVSRIAVKGALFEMKENLSQKLIHRHLAAPAELKPGTEISLTVDHTLTHDINAVMAYLAFEALGVPRVKTKLSVSYIDHNLLQIDNKTPDDHIYLQTLAKKYGLVLSKAGNGICHTLHCSRFGKPGAMLLGGDSHTPSCGALGMLAIGVGGMDIATALAGIPYVINMPKIVKVELKNRLNPGVAAKDIVLEMLRRVSVKGGTGKIFEYVGDGAAALSVPERMTITNMGAEMNATTSVFPADEAVRKFLKAQGREADFEEILPDEGCTYDEEMTIDLAALEPLVALPHLPDHVVTVREAPKQPVQQVFIGSCTNGSYADFRKAAAVLKGHEVAENVSLVCGISSRQIYMQLMKDGIIAELMNAGARVLELACGPCCGIGCAPSTKGISVRTSNRNFKGRSSTPDASLFLVSPETAAATAVKGVLATADEVMDDVSVLADIHEPENYPINDNLFLKPAPEGNNVEIIRGPNIKPLPVADPPEDNLVARVSLKARDNVSTDDITPASAQFSSMRSNMPAMAQYAFCRYDPAFAKRAQAMKKSFIIGGSNYGQGSSREHAAITPMYLGVKMIITKGFARIHKNNLINHGIIPCVFVNSEDYDRVDQEDELAVTGLRGQMKQHLVTVENRTKRFSFQVRLETSELETEILLAGGKLRYTKKILKNS
jgi:aconitate hydratase